MLSLKESMFHSTDVLQSITKTEIEMYSLSTSVPTHLWSGNICGVHREQIGVVIHSFRLVFRVMNNECLINFSRVTATMKRNFERGWNFIETIAPARACLSSFKTTRRRFRKFSSAVGSICSIFSCALTRGTNSRARSSQLSHFL